MSDEIDRTVLPIRRPQFGGVVNRTLDGSEPDWNFVAPIPAPDGAPNVLLVLIDDAGFGNPGTFGGPISTPSLDRLADGGLKYNRFHVTAMCSPTRAALMTGRNHHSVGFGMVSEFAAPFPGYSATLPKDCQTQFIATRAEEHLLALGPPRSHAGKTASMVIPIVLSQLGPVVTAS